MKKNVDYTTWCNAKISAAPILAKILNEQNNQRTIKKVGLHLHRFQYRLKTLESLPLDVRKYFGDFHLKATINSIVGYSYEKNIETHLLNVIITLYRIANEKCGLKKK